MAKSQLFFVCRHGHVFRSLKVMKSGRVRQCPVCLGITPDRRGKADMEAARRLASSTRFGRSYTQVFTKGEVIAKPKIAPSRS